MIIRFPWLRPALVALGLLCVVSSRGEGPVRPRLADVPEALRPWVPWVLWDETPLADAPAPYQDAKQRLPFWPSALGLTVDKTGGRFALGVTVFRDGWVPLPGDGEQWPQEVRVDGQAAPVVGRDGIPQVRLTPGAHRVEGAFRWAEIPQRLAVPREVGVLTLTLDGRVVEAPAWDAEGQVWLRRDAASGEVDRDFLGVKLYGALEDGIPMWLRVEVEVSVAGKSREEDLGVVLPAGWRLASVESPIPVAVDDAGRMKAQVRAGKWTVRADAFRLDRPGGMAFADGAKVAAEEMLLAFRARPEFRLVEVRGLPSVDVSQATFPEKWQGLPVYRWDTARPVTWEERMRGMGSQKPAGLTMQRDLWLDESGAGFTFRDRIAGEMQQVWRLDAAPGQTLGSVRAGQRGQLVTRNPDTGASGVEIRTRKVELEATGRVERGRELPATGWLADMDGAQVRMNLPPGWRLFAVLGADTVRGDWVTAWTLLDLFWLLIFTAAVFRLRGLVAAVVACLGLALSYHEPGAPRVVWLALLVPVALLGVVPAGWMRGVVQGAKWLSAGALVLLLVPFVGTQLQQAIYPQLERVPGVARPSAGSFSAAQTPMQGSDDYAANSPAPSPAAEAADALLSETSRPSKLSWRKSGANLSYDTKARIQTGPGVPAWGWRSVSYGWSGPVRSGQTVRPILLPSGVERGVTVVRVALLLALAYVLLRTAGGAKGRGAGRAPAVAAAVMAACLWGGVPAGARAQGTFPDPKLLGTLRERMLQTPDAPAVAADIPSVSLSLQEQRLVMEAEIHCAGRTAVPLPGRLPAWSPVAVTVDGKPEATLRRDDGFLWVVLAGGVHRVRVEGRLANVTEWEWSFHLRPHRVTIDAPGWNVTGVRPDGRPEEQVFFVQQQKSAPGESTYERQDLQPLVQVERHLEMGLAWQVRTTVTRLSPAGKALALRVPLLAGESVLSGGAVIKEGAIEVRLGAQDTTFAWESELAVTNRVALTTRADDTWVEQWRLVASPVWNVALSGLAPTFEADKTELVPGWNPWPGESVELSVSRPEAVSGATVTVESATQTVSLGRRQRTGRLELFLRCSLGEDFVIGLPAGAEVSELKQDDQMLPVRLDGGRLTVPLRPGGQRLSVAWRLDGDLATRSRVDGVTLPVEAANITTVVNVPGDRWVLGTDGPLRGPAVRFWTILAGGLLAAVVLGRLANSPLRTVEWLLLMLGLTQVPPGAGLIVVGWLFLLQWRGTDSWQRLERVLANLLQAFLAGLTLVALGVLVAVVGEGLLGRPEMFIEGNGSSASRLQWYLDRCGPELPQPGCWTVSIWWYRFAMLVWALWLALALLKWLKWGWGRFTQGGWWRRDPEDDAPAPPQRPPALPKGP